MVKNPFSVVILGLIAAYRFGLSPILGANCRHMPSCSQYAKDAVIQHGPLHGSYYAVKRILRCHPWATPRFDPVPPRGKRAMPCCKTNADNGEG